MPVKERVHIFFMYICFLLPPPRGQLSLNCLKFRAPCQAFSEFSSIPGISPLGGERKNIYTPKSRNSPLGLKYLKCTFIIFFWLKQYWRWGGASPAVAELFLTPGRALTRPRYLLAFFLDLFGAMKQFRKELSHGTFFLSKVFKRCRLSSGIENPQDPMLSRRLIWAETPVSLQKSLTALKKINYKKQLITNHYLQFT